MALNKKPYRGCRDFFPENMRVREFLFNQMKKSAEQFGYQPYDGPLLEEVELYKAKSGEADLKSLVPTDRDAPPLNLPKGEKVALPPPLPKNKTDLQESAQYVASQIKSDYDNFFKLIYEQKALHIYCQMGVAL